MDETAEMIQRLLRDPKRERTRDVIQLTEPDDRGVVVVVTPDSIEVRRPSLEWIDSHRAVPSSRHLARLDIASDEVAIAHAVIAARAAREAEFLRCRFCGDTFPPERRHSADVCHACAENHMGVVH